ncbi:hypothetical protein QQF64_014156 [Cirrhinus molitorella]|uniref:Uncharacterized protein n=1 Tax=Cirrhinus molitorella TaxID=172907 RepID=A0ABR3LUE3_9TELE
MFTASGPGCSSHLYNSIRSYLHNQNRAQPIVGLNSITEVLTYNQPALYLCDVCGLRITKTDIRNHIMGSIHRYNYIKSHHAHGWTSDTDLTLLARPLMDIAKKVEKKEGTGDIQVLNVDEVIYKEMTSLPVSDAFAQMKTIKDQRNSNAVHSLVHNSPSEGNESSAQGQQEADSMKGTAQLPALGCLVPTQTPSMSKCSSMIEPQQVLTNPTPNPSLHRTAGPVKPLFTCQDVSTPQSLVDSHVSSRINFLESSPAPVSSQNVNQHQHVIPDRSPQKYIMPSENQYFNQVSKISVITTPRQCIPIRSLCQNDIMHAGEDDGNSSVQSFGVGYESHPRHLAQTTPYEIQLQTQSLSMSHMVPELTQDLTNRHVIFGNESPPDSPESVRDVEIVIKQIRTQMLTEVLEPAETHDSSHSHDESNSQEPINTVWEAHEEAQSGILAEKNFFQVSQSPIAQSPLTQTQSPSDQFQSIEDFLENYNGQKPLIGLQAVIKCQSVDGNPPPCCYLCQLCSLKLKKKKIFSHLTGFDHLRNYLKALHPQLLPKKRKHCNTNEMIENIAIQLEKEDGRGHIKVMRLSACLISEVLQKDYHWCMKMLNCGADVGWRSGLLSFKEGTNNATGPSQTLKRLSESVLPPSDNNTTGPSQTLKRQVESTLPPLDCTAPDGAPTPQMSKKMKKGHPNKVICTKKVKEPVFKVSLSLQEGPVIIERTTLRDTTTVAPEIEDQNPVTTCTENNALPLATNAHSEVQMCVHSCMYENQFTNPPHYAYPGQFDQSQVMQNVKPSLRPMDCGPVTYADWPVQDWSCYNNQWIMMRQNMDGRDHYECAGYMQY